MNNIDKHYQTLLQDILDNGIEKSDRTGTGTISVFGRQIRHKMSDGFPLLTTKKMAWKSIVAELLWFLRGDTNIKFLLDYDCYIWDGDAYKNYSKTIDNVIDGYKSGDIMGMQPHIEKWFSNSDELTPLTKEQFIKNIKTDKEFAERWGDLGPIYGKQWRRWETDDLDAPRYEHWKKDIDQIQNLIDELKTNPDSRRLMVSAWNVGEINHMVLPPCHYGFQLYTRPTTREEKIINPGKYRAISLMWNQRSVDTFLGLPFNIASYALLLEIIAKEVDMVPDELIGNLGDVHLYSNHLEQAKMQILRKPYSLPRVNITERNWYQHELVKERLGPKSFSEKILSYRPDCFELIGYESHSGIKAPLSN
jgi:thymidylate synthase